jgi:uncharacterized repeat protein (TIGR03803 family)
VKSTNAARSNCSFATRWTRAQAAARNADHRRRRRVTQAIGSALQPHLEAMESRVLLSAYTATELGSFGVNATGANPRSTLVADASGSLYGTSIEGGTYGYGTVFEISNGSNAITTLASFNNGDGASPYAGLTLDGSGNLYGTTYSGGAYGDGTVFEMANGSMAITTLALFDGADGRAPFAGLTMDASGNLYGTAEDGGANEAGTVFEIAKGSNAITTLASFNEANGRLPQAGVTLDTSGNLYGSTSRGGSNNAGTAFEIARGSTAITTLASFSTSLWPQGNVVVDPSGNLYGTSSSGGTYNDGLVFETAAGSGAVTMLASFNHANGDAPESGLTMDSSGNLYGTTSYGGSSGAGTVFEITHGSTAITTLASLNRTNGRYPVGGVTFDAFGDLYGTTYYGGAHDRGAVFEVAKGTTAATLVASFNASTGAVPVGGLARDASGNLFGTTEYAGSANDGTLFEIASGSDVVTTLVTFNGTNGSLPVGRLTFDASGNLYGTTYEGGAGGVGTVFEMAESSNALTILASFNATNGGFPWAGVTMDASGNLYGTTLNGGSDSDGTAFEVAKGSGVITTLVKFNGTANGSAPTGGLTLDASGNLYGTTQAGGPNDAGTVFQIPKGSTALTTIAAFDYTNGDAPTGTLVLDAAGDLYGVTGNGGPGGGGTVFEITKGSNAITTLATFIGANGAGPNGLTVDVTGNLFGTTTQGGNRNYGTIFEIGKGSAAITTLISFSFADGGPRAALVLDPLGDLFGTTANVAGTAFKLTPNTATTLAAQEPNPSSTGRPLSFTATVTGGVPDGETVTLVDANSGGNATVATGTVSGGSATLTIPTGTLGVGTHNLVAAYGGDANFAASESVAYAQIVQAASPPTLVGTPVINGDNPNGLFNALGQTTPGQQRSMVEDIVYTFNEAVTIPDANAAFTVAVAGSAGGTVPTTLFAQAVVDSNGTQWAVSLTGKAEGTLASIANGEYSIQINPAGVFGTADGTTAMAAGTGRIDKFFRLFGDIDGNESVSTLDYGRFKQALNGAYNPAFDYDGNTAISTLDYGRFKQDMPISYFGDGFVTTI